MHHDRQPERRLPGQRRFRARGERSTLLLGIVFAVLLLRGIWVLRTAYTRYSEILEEGAGAPLVEARFDAAYLHNPKPPYPPASSRLREEGTVRLRVHVLPDGSADQVEIWRGSGSTRLDESARAAVRRWRFVPGRRGGETIASWVIVPIHFNME